MPYQKVTMIDDLPDLDQIDPMSQAQPMVAKQRGIRTTDRVGSIPQESGMSYYQQPTPDIYESQSPYSGENPMYDRDLGRNYRPKSGPLFEPYESMAVKPCEYNCKCIYEHVKECDICKRFYRPDTTPYLIIILILIIACAMMGKKLFNF